MSKLLEHDKLERALVAAIRWAVEAAAVGTVEIVVANEFDAEEGVIEDHSVLRHLD